MIKDAIRKVIKSQGLWQGCPDVHCPFCGKETFHGVGWEWYQIGRDKYKEKTLRCNDCNATQRYKYIFETNEKSTLIEIIFSKNRAKK